jgi:hypothetical protein
MIKGLMREVSLAIQAKSGLTTGFFVGLGSAALTALTAFAFLCVAAYQWLETLFGGVYAGLIEAGFFLLVAVIAAALGMSSRQRARQRAILERAARGHAASWLLDPKIVTAVVQVGRSLGWQRLVPIALLGFLAAQWAREYREQDRGEKREDSQ